MKKTVVYTYLGSNGTITSKVHLEGIYSIQKCELLADKDKLLTKDYDNFVKLVIVPEVEVKDWIEVDEAFGQK